MSSVRTRYPAPLQTPRTLRVAGRFCFPESGPARSRVAPPVAPPPAFRGKVRRHARADGEAVNLVSQVVWRQVDVREAEDALERGRVHPRMARRLRSCAGGLESGSGGRTMPTGQIRWSCSGQRRRWSSTWRSTRPQPLVRTPVRWPTTMPARRRSPPEDGTASSLGTWSRRGRGKTRVRKPASQQGLAALDDTYRYSSCL